MSSDSTNSLCSIYAELIETELESDNPDYAEVYKLLGYIKRWCQTVSTPPGETPPQLEPHLYESGSEAEGTVVVDGQPLPKSAAEKMDTD
jgi:hypothetical protein